MLLAPTCPGCGRTGAAPCAECIARVRLAPPFPPPHQLDQCLALLAYEDEGRELVAQLKYRNARSVAGWLGEAMAERAAPLVTRATVVTWAPTTALRRRRRGFDHAELLARSVARHLGLPNRSLLVRAPGPPQTGRSLLERSRGPAFLTRRGGAPPHVLLIDDVVTTGATLTAAARALRAGGAISIVGLCAAHPP